MQLLVSIYSTLEYTKSQYRHVYNGQHLVHNGTRVIVELLVCM